MTEEELANISECNDVLVKVIATGNEGYITGYNYPSGSGFHVDIELPNYPTCGQSVFHTVKVRFDGLEILKVEEE